MGQNMSEWHSANKVVWMIDVCISQFFVWNSIRLPMSISSINCGSCLKAIVIIRGCVWGQSNRGYFSIRSSYLGLYDCIWDLCWTNFYMFLHLCIIQFCVMPILIHSLQFRGPLFHLLYSWYNYMFQLNVGNIKAVKWLESSTQHV